MNIAIIGAGPAGIISARNAIKAGHSVVLFEKNAHIGGIWNPWSESFVAGTSPPGRLKRDVVISAPGKSGCGEQAAEVAAGG